MSTTLEFSGWRLAAGSLWRHAELHQSIREEERDPYLPRPALGRRPWFAFLRRARMRRRFAFAMGEEATSASGARHMPFVVASTTGWRSAPVRVAFGATARRRGLLPLPGPYGLLLRTRSVHSFGMRDPVGWVAFDRRGTVRASGILRPGRVVWVQRAEFILEQPADLGLPLPGERATVLATDR